MQIREKEKYGEKLRKGGIQIQGKSIASLDKKELKSQWGTGKIQSCACHLVLVPLQIVNKWSSTFPSRDVAKGRFSDFYQIKIYLEICVKVLTFLYIIFSSFCLPESKLRVWYGTQSYSIRSMKTYGLELIK